MSVKTTPGQNICPFTLEPCEYCSEWETVNEKKICPFTLEPCAFEVTGNLHHCGN